MNWREQPQEGEGGGPFLVSLAFPKAVSFAQLAELAHHLMIHLWLMVVTGQMMEAGAYLEAD